MSLVYSTPPQGFKRFVVYFLEDKSDGNKLFLSPKHLGSFSILQSAHICILWPVASFQP